MLFVGFIIPLETGLAPTTVRVCRFSGRGIGRTGVGEEGLECRFYV